MNKLFQNLLKNDFCKNILIHNMNSPTTSNQTNVPNASDVYKYDIKEEKDPKIRYMMAYYGY